MPSSRSLRAYLSLPVLACMSLFGPAAAPAALPKVVSINLCTDQLLLSVAEPSQILSLSWLSAHPEESMLADAAAAYPLNYGSAEELLRLGADVLIAGSETSPFTRDLLRRLGAVIVEVRPANSIADIAANLRQVGAAIDRTAQAEAVVAQMLERAQQLQQQQTEPARRAIVVRPGGFTIARGTLAFELLALAGLENSVAELDRWGSLSIETLVSEQPDILVMTRYRDDQPSMANAIFTHPALTNVATHWHTLNVHGRYFACGAPDSLQAVADLLAQMSAL
jgi:iron complex transport system substrate-binding protein